MADFTVGIHLDEGEELELLTYTAGETAQLPAYVTLKLGMNVAIYPHNADQCAEIAEHMKAAEKFLREASQPDSEEAA